jgi:hypothetical protein
MSENLVSIGLVPCPRTAERNDPAAKKMPAILPALHELKSSSQLKAIPKLKSITRLLVFLSCASFLLKLSSESHWACMIAKKRRYEVEPPSPTFEYIALK